MGRKKKEPIRAIEIEGLDMTLELSKATAVRTSKNMIHLDQLEDGTWRLIYNPKMIPDFTRVRGFKMIRDDEQEPLSLCPKCKKYTVKGQPRGGVACTDSKCGYWFCY